MTDAPARETGRRNGLHADRGHGGAGADGLVLSALASITAQWLPNWNRGFDRIQRSELVGISLRADRSGSRRRRICAAPTGISDKSAVRWIGAVRHVRAHRVGTERGAGARCGAHRRERPRSRRLVTVRSRAAFGPVPPRPLAVGTDQRFGDPVVLLRPPFRLSFAYAGPDRVFGNTWQEADRLPAAIRLTVRDVASGRILSVSTVTPVHVDAPAGFGNSGDQSNDDAGVDGKIVGAAPKRGGS